MNWSDKGPREPGNAIVAKGLDIFQCKMAKTRPQIGFRVKHATSFKTDQKYGTNQDINPWQDIKLKQEKELPTGAMRGTQLPTSNKQWPDLNY